MPGFDLAAPVRRAFPPQAGPQTIGMVLLNHGIFSFGATARESLRADDRAGLAAPRSYLERRGRLADLRSRPGDAAGSADAATSIAALRREISRAAGVPDDPGLPPRPARLAFARRDGPRATISQQGPATPDHVIRTKRLPLLGRDVDGVRQAYRRYFARTRHAGRRDAEDDARSGAAGDPRSRARASLTAGTRTVKDAAIVAEIYEHTMDIILRAERARRLPGAAGAATCSTSSTGTWSRRSWRKAGKPPVFAGEVALVTGAASGIGKACVESLLARGAAVVGLDIDPAIETMLQPAATSCGVRCDVTDEAEVDGGARARRSRAFGGLDMLVLNAGIFPAGRTIADLAARRVGPGDARSTWTPTCCCCATAIRCSSSRRAAAGWWSSARRTCRRPGPAPRPTRPPRRRSTSSPAWRRSSGAADGIRVNVAPPQRGLRHRRLDRRRCSPRAPRPTA